MSVAASPQTKFAAALLAAGVASAASFTSLPEQRGLPTVRVDVANASAVTDVLLSLGKGVEVASSLVGIHVDAVVSVPFEASLAVLAAAQHPELSANVLSYLVQRFVNPAVGAPITAYPWETEQAVALLASLLPYPLGPGATDPGLVNEARLAFADVFDSVLGQLPDPLPGYEAVQDVMNDTVLGGAIEAGQLAVRAPLYMAWNTVNYLGMLPAYVEATIESAIQTPDQIPGLVSSLIYGLLSPDAEVGLLGKLLNNVADPFTWLPAPIGNTSNATGLANQIRTAITDAMNGILSLLPAPVRSSALPTTLTEPEQPTYAVDAGKGAVTPDSLPSASVALSDSVVLAPAKLVETHSDATASKVDEPVTPTNEDVAPATAEAASPDAGVTAPDAEDGDAEDGDAKDGDAKDGDAKLKPDKTGKHRAAHPSRRVNRTTPSVTESPNAERPAAESAPSDGVS